MTNNNNKYTFFFHLTSPFSNFHPSKFQYKEFTFISNEQFMMFSKAKNFKDEEVAKKILNLNNNPLAQSFLKGEVSRLDIVNDKEMSAQWNKLMMSIKRLGREVSNYNDEFWSKKRKSVVLFGAREKFKQNEDLKQVLINTGISKMVECSPYDKVWACGLTEYEAKKTPEDKWPGLNLLGNLLDQLKLEFNNELVKDKSKTVTYQPIEVMNFYHLGKIIPEDGEYIGRVSSLHDFKGSKFANPFPVRSPAERGSSIGKYRDWLWQQIANNVITKHDLLSLNGKKLVCYCKPLACHGDVVKEVVELLVSNEVEFDNKVEKAKDIKSKLKVS